MRVNELSNKNIWGIAVIIVCLMLAITVVFIKPIAYQHMVGKQYGSEWVNMYKEWHSLQIDSPGHLVSFKKPNISEFSIAAEYDFKESSKSLILNDYNAVLAKNNWMYIGEKDQAHYYVKNNLELFLANIDKNKWQIRIIPKGFREKGILQRLIFGIK